MSAAPPWCSACGCSRTPLHCCSRLDGNPLTYFPPDVFYGNAKLKRLFVQGTFDEDFPSRRPGIPSLHPDLFLNSPLLEEVHLDNNMMVSLPPGLFRANPLLKFLSVRYNQIDELPDNLFDNEQTKPLFELCVLRWQWRAFSPSPSLPLPLSLCFCLCLCQSHHAAETSATTCSSPCPPGGFTGLVAAPTAPPSSK